MPVSSIHILGYCGMNSFQGGWPGRLSRGLSAAWDIVWVDDSSWMQCFWHSCINVLVGPVLFPVPRTVVGILLP